MDVESASKKGRARCAEGQKFGQQQGELVLVGAGEPQRADPMAREVGGCSRLRFALRHSSLIKPSKVRTASIGISVCLCCHQQLDTHTRRVLVAACGNRPFDRQKHLEPHPFRLFCHSKASDSDVFRSATSTLTAAQQYRRPSLVAAPSCRAIALSEHP
jgi:hypothetical protein